MKNKTKKGFLIKQESYFAYRKIPIYILDIDYTKLFPIRYRFKGKGYKILEFTALKSEIEFCIE